VETVDDAVQLLGRNELRRWLEMMLMGAAEARQATPALQESALARGRLLELLARQRGEPETAARARFTLGMFSMLEVLLQVPLAEALAPLRLGEVLEQALLQHSGPWADELTLAQACDLGDEASFLAAAERLGGVEQVLPLVEEAWGWAALASGTVAKPTAG
jgi:EAL and modified HD-GYP domain-containing signal transduction protein